MGFFAKIFGKKDSMTLEEANDINQQYIEDNPTPTDDENGLLRRASSALTSGSFKEAVQIYEEMAEKFPESKGMYLSQVGAAYYFLNEFDKAIEYYISARDHGADASMMDDNIWEACEAIYKNTNEINSIQRYLELCPNGSYTKKANKLISK
ncbi:MAG: hypothetical protein MRY83_17680 [Flavobacteriales bacterium]|nr:hypothetical protein [Flavobacteriales bacterium]